MLYYKKHTGKTTIPYNEAVEEALCFGWIDSLVRRIDEERYVRKFTPRRERSDWSVSNRERALKMFKKGLMTEAGLKKIESYRKKGVIEWEEVRETLTFVVSDFVYQRLESDPEAFQCFKKLSTSHQKQFIGWIYSAKKIETKEKRLKKAIRMLKEGKQPGMK